MRSILEEIKQPGAITHAQQLVLYLKKLKSKGHHACTLHSN
jgi:hypothetical protein